MAVGTLPGLSSKSPSSRKLRLTRGTSLPRGPPPPFTGGGAATLLKRRPFPGFPPISEASGSVCASPSPSPRRPALAAPSVSGFRGALRCISSPAPCSGLHSNCSLCWAALGLLAMRSLSPERPPPARAVASSFLSHALGSPDPAGRPRVISTWFICGSRILLALPCGLLAGISCFWASQTWEGPWLPSHGPGL